MSCSKPSQTSDLGFIAPPAPVGGRDFISDLRLWAQTRLGFNGSQPLLLFGGPTGNQPIGTYPDGRYDDEYYPSSELYVDETGFDISENPFEDQFIHWTRMTSYPSLNGRGHPMGPAFKILSQEITTSSSQSLTFRADAAEFQWLWLYFHNLPGRDQANFDIRIILFIEVNGSVVVANARDFTNPSFGRLTLRSRQITPRYSLRLVIERINVRDFDDDSVLGFRLAGRLGYRLGVTSNLTT